MQNQHFHKYVFSSLFAVGCLMFQSAYATRPVFAVSPLVKPQNYLKAGETGTAIYQVFNTSQRNLSNIALKKLPVGVAQDTTAFYGYCGAVFSLNAGESCLIKMQVNASQLKGTVTEGPFVCFSNERPVYCSQPFFQDQLHIQKLDGAIPQSCSENAANFNFELTQNLDSAAPQEPLWGSLQNTFMLSNANPDLTNCAATAGASWQRERVLAAAEFWINQKMNYCHHHIPDYKTPVADRGASNTQPGYCSNYTDLDPNSIYYTQHVRWNYDGKGSETSFNWNDNERRWYGVDCSNYTALLYNFAFGTLYTSDVGYQAGQRSNGSQTNLTPNQQTPGNELDNPNAPGSLVCADNTLEVAHSCTGHGGYMSVIDSAGQPTLTITDAMLNNLQPGDLLYIADASKPDNPYNSRVTHVIMWTGKKIGDSENDIPENRIAPNMLCPNDWQPVAGGWVITDSHYQGADYRMFTQCFYRENVWGVRRVFT